MNTFTRDGVSFRFPTNWHAETDEGEDGGWAVTISSPDTAFVLVSLRPDTGDPAALADQTLEVLTSEYKELDAENRVETISGQPAIGHDIDFLTVDVPVVCRVRCLQTTAGPLLILVQTAEPEFAHNDPVLRAIVASLTIDEE